MTPIEQTASADAPQLLAQHSNWRHLGDRFTGQGADLQIGEILMLVGACVLAGALIWLLKWASNREEDGQVKPNPKRLFRELCQTHGLKRSDAKLLVQLAERSDAEQPAEVFLRPELYTETTELGFSPDDEAALAIVAETLFADVDRAGPGEGAFQDAGAGRGEGPLTVG